MAMLRTRAEWAAVLLVGCRGSHDVSDAPLARPTASSPVAESATDCERVRACLTALPHEYGPSTRDLSERVAACLGKSPLEKWNSRACVPFEIATEATSGRKIEAYVTCSDVCPDYVRAGIRYVDVRQPECECLGGETIGFGDVACAPGGTTRSEGPGSFEVSESRPNELKPKGAFPHVRFAYLGLDKPIDSVNGGAIRDADGLRSFAGRLLSRPPADVRFWQSGQTRVVYAAREAFDDLASRLSAFPVAAASRSPNCPAPEGASGVSVCLGDRRFGCDLKRDAACASFVAEVEKTAKSPRAAGPLARWYCADLRTVRTFLGVRYRDRAVELRYVDWMPPLADDRAGK
jgi:hypothetical protein